MMSQTVIPSLPSLPAIKKWPAQGDWTYEDYLRLPDDGRRYEIIRGVLYVSNAPSHLHQYTVGRIFLALALYVETMKLGEVVVAPIEVHLPGIAKPVLPDVIFIATAQQPAPGYQYFTGAPDLVVEVLSPNTYRLDQSVKLDAYEQAGVREYWLANPKTRTVTVYILPERGREYVLLGEFTPGEKVQSALFSGLDLTVRTLFVPTEENA